VAGFVIAVVGAIYADSLRASMTPVDKPSVVLLNM